MQRIEAIINAAGQAASLVQQMQAGGLLDVRTKSSAIDLVTSADVAAEHFLRRTLEEIEPGLGFWGEESKADSGLSVDDSYWLVDPVDGTVNFAHGLPYWAVNVALVRSGQVEVGVTVQSPWTRVYWAEVGQGAWLREPGLGERRLRVSPVTRLAEAFLASGFPYHSSEQSDNNLRELSWMLPHCLGLRVLGAGALDVAQVAAGMLAGFWEGWMEPWDVGAGNLLVAEAGGVVSDYAGNPWSHGSPGYLATNGHIHAAMLDAIRTARAGISDPLLTI